MKPKRYAPLNVSGNELNGFVTAWCQLPSETEWHLVLLYNHPADYLVCLLQPRGSFPACVNHILIFAACNKILYFNILKFGARFQMLLNIKKKNTFYCVCVYSCARQLKLLENWLMACDLVFDPCYPPLFKFKNKLIFKIGLGGCLYKKD